MGSHWIDIPEILFKKKGFNIQLFNSGYKDLNPLEEEKLHKMAFEIWGLENFNTEKCVLVGDQLTSDILFGNLCNMKTIWVHNNNQITDCLKNRS